MRQLRLGTDKTSERGSGSSFKQRIISNWRLIFVLLVIMAVAFILRVFFAYDVAVAGGYGLSGGSNAAYHVVVIEYIMNNWSHLVENTAINYPYGEINVNPPLMDWILAIIAQFVTLFGVSATAAAEGTLIWSTAILGTLTCLPIYYLGKEMFNHRTGIIAALLYAVCAIAISQTVLSNGTEAAFYGFFFSIMLLYIYRAVKASKATVPDRAKGEFKSYAKGVFGVNRQALKYALIAGIMLAIVELSWNGFRPIIVMIALIMVVQAILDRVRYKDPTSVTLIFATVLIVSTVISAPVYALAGLWSIVYSGPFFIVILSVIFAAVMSETKGRPWLLVLPILIIALAVVLLVMWFAVPGLYSDLVSGNSIYFDPTFNSLVDMNSGTSLSAMAGYYGWFTMWLPYIVIALMFYKFREQLESHSKTFVLLWLIAMMAISWSGSSNVYLAAPAYVIGAGVFLSWMLEKADFKSYVAGFKGIGFHVKAILKKIFQPIPLVSVLVAVFLVAAPNAMYAIDASTSTNQKSDSSGSLEDYMGAFGYYVKNDTDWKMNDVWNYYSDQEKSGALLSWWDYSAEAVAKGGFNTVAGANGSGAAAASNMLLSNGSGSNIAMAIRLMEYEGIDKFQSFLTGTLGLTSEEYNILKEILEMRDTNKWRSTILANPDKYGKFDGSISDENVMYVAATYFLLNDIRYNTTDKAYEGLTLTETVTLYDYVCSQSTKGINYIAVSRGMFPIASGDGSVFSTLAYMNNYYVDSNGAPTQFYTSNSSGTYNYTQAMYDSVLWKAYIGPSPSDLGYSSAVTMMNTFALSDGSENTRPQPGFGLSNYVISYWRVMYNPDSEATQDSEGWVEMDAFEAMDLQDDLRAQGKEAGLINFMSGLPVVLEYVPSNGQNMVKGEITSGSNPIEGARVSVFDENGMQMATVFTNSRGEYSVYVPYSSGKITFSVGSTNLKGGLIIRTLNYGPSDPLPTVDYDISVDPVKFAGQIYYEDVDEADLVLLEGTLNFTIVGAAHGMEASGTFSNGTFTSADYTPTDLVPDKYTITVKDANGNTVYTGTFEAVLGYGTDVQIRMFLTSATLNLDITDEYGSPITSETGLGSTSEKAYVKLVSTEPNTSSGVPYEKIVELVDGKATAKVVPGTYKATLVNDLGAEHGSNELFDAYVTVASGGTATLTAKAQLYQNLTVNYPTGTGMVLYASNVGYQTSIVLPAAGSSVTFKVPVSIEAICNYYLYARYTTDAGEDKILYPTAGTMVNVMATQTIALNNLSSALDAYEFSRTLKTTEGEAVTGYLNFYPDTSSNVPFISTWSINGKVSVWLPAGNYIMHAYSGDSDVKEAYMDRIEITGSSRGGDIDLVKGKTMIVEILYSDSGSGRIPYSNLTITDSNKNITLNMAVNGNGLLSTIVPADGAYSFTVNKKIGNFIMVGTDDGGKVTQKGATSTNFVTAIFRTTTPTSYDDAAPGITFVDQFGDVVANGVNGDPVKVKLKLNVSTSSEVEFDIVNGKLDLGTYKLSIGEYTVTVDKEYGYYYSGTMKLYVSNAPVEIELKKLDIITFENLGENDKITVNALDSSKGVYYSDDREEVLDVNEEGTGVYTETYYFEQDKQFQIKIMNSEGDKVWQYYHFVGHSTAVPTTDSLNVELKEFITVEGYAGYPASGLVTIVDSHPTNPLKIVVTASSSGRFTVEIPTDATDNIKATAVLGSYLDDNDVEHFTYSAAQVSKTLDQIKDNGSMLNLVAVTTDPKADDPEDVLTTVGGVYLDANGEVRIQFNVTGNTYQSLFPSGGTGWEYLEFYDGDPSSSGTRIDHINGGTGTFWAKGKLNVDVALDSSNLMITLKNAAGTSASTCEIDLTANVISGTPDITEEIIVGRDDADVYGDSEYKFAILLNNKGNSPKEFIITPDSIPAGWYVVFTDKDGKEVTAGSMTYTIPGKTEFIAYVKLINDNAQSLPESMTVTVRSVNALIDNTNLKAGEDATKASENDDFVTVTISPTDAKLDNNGGGASGPNIFGTAGSITMLTWALIVITILLFVLILWMGMKRGVFLRKK